MDKYEEAAGIWLGEEIHTEWPGEKLIGAAFRWYDARPERETCEWTIEDARALASWAWCDPENSNKVMDSALAESFAKLVVRNCRRIVEKEGK